MSHAILILGMSDAVSTRIQHTAFIAVQTRRSLYKTMNRLSNHRSQSRLPVVLDADASAAVSVVAFSDVYKLIV